MPQVTMPDGTVVEMPDQVDPARGARLRASQQAQIPMDDRVPSREAPTPQEAPSLWERTKQFLGADGGSDPIIDMWRHGLKTIGLGAPEAVGTLATNAAVTAGAGLGSALEGPDYVQDMQSRFGYQPRGESAQDLVEGLGRAFDFTPIKDALGDTTLDATGSPLAATGASMIPDLAATLFPANKLVPKARETAVSRGAVGGMDVGAPAPGGQLAPERALPPKPDLPDAVGAARAAGYELRPSDIQAAHPAAKVPGTTRERFADAPELKKDTTLKNQVQTTRNAGEEIGLKDATEISEQSLDAARKPHLDTYTATGDAVGKFAASPEFAKELGGIWQREGLEPQTRVKIRKQVKAYENGEISGPDAIKTISALRRRAAKQMQSEDVTQNDMGATNRAIADALENEIARRLEGGGDAKLVGQFRDARTALAKIHDVDTATIGGQVDAATLARLQDRGVKLSGKLKLIADTAARYPNVLKHSRTTAARAGGEMADSRSGLIKDAAKSVIRKIPGMDVGSKRFQDKNYGKVDPVRAEYYGREAPPAPVKVDEPVQAFDSMEFSPTPGVMPVRAARETELELAPERVDNPDALPETPDMLTADTPPPVRGDVDFEPTDLADDLGLEIDIRTGTRDAVGEQELADLLAEQGAGDLRVAPRDMEQLDLGVALEQPRRLELDPPPGTTRGGKTKQRGFLRIRDEDPFTNNASGDSSASAEAISRVQQEKAAGQDRFVIDLDDTVTPLTGVDAVDARARKGQVIVQRGIGKDEYTVLDRGGLSASQAKGRIQAAFRKRE